jgi:hypothetical protein
MGKCTRTVGERRLGRTIYKLGNSVELSSKEGQAKVAEQKTKKKTQTDQDATLDSPIKNLREAAANRQKNSS